jgi:hypothetical protein
MAKSKKNIELKGLSAYNHIAKIVKQSLQNQEVELKAGKYFSKTSAGSFRDIVKKSFEKSKGKSKAEIERISIDNVQEVLIAEGYITPIQQLPETGSGYDWHNVPYWSMGDFLFDTVTATEISIDNSIFSNVPSFEGKKEDFTADDNSTIIRELNRIRKELNLDSGTVPSYSAYTDKKGVFRIVLISRAGVDENWEETKLTELERIKDEGTGKTGGKKAVKEKKIAPIINIYKDDIGKEEFETARLKKEVAQVELLEKKKEALMKSFEFYNKAGLKKQMMKVVSEIEKLDDEILKIK